MTIDEAIEQFKYDAECNRADLDLSYAEDNEQIAEWLEDYKHIKQWKSDVMDDFCRYDASSFEELIANARNKAIDEFVIKLKRVRGYGLITNFDRPFGVTFNKLDEIAEEMKGGAE